MSEARDEIREWLTTRAGGLPEHPDELDEFITKARGTLTRAYTAAEHIPPEDVEVFSDEVATLAELLNSAELERDHRRASNLRAANEVRDQIGQDPAASPRPALDYWTAKYGHLLAKKGGTP